MTFMLKGADEYGVIASKAFEKLEPYFGGGLSMGEVKEVDSFPSGPGANQLIKGSKTIICSIHEGSGALLEAVSTFAGEHFPEITDGDALDAAGELLNFISGAYAEEMSRNGQLYELYPPEYGKMEPKAGVESIRRLEFKAGSGLMYFVFGVLK